VEVCRRSLWAGLYPGVNAGMECGQPHAALKRCASTRSKEERASSLPVDSRQAAYNQASPSPQPPPSSMQFRQVSKELDPKLRWLSSPRHPTDASYQLVASYDCDAEQPAVSALTPRRPGGWCELGMGILSSVFFQASMALIILANAIVIGLETDFPDLGYWDPLEMIFLVIFSAELVLKLLVIGLKGYFDIESDDFNWNLFDFLIVSLGAFDASVSLTLGSHAAGGTATLFRIVRLLRILRIFRIVRFLRQLYMLAFGLALATSAIFWVTFLMTFVLYVCSIVLVRTLGRTSEDDPHHEILIGSFGNIRRSMLTLFQLMSQPDLRPYDEVIPERPLFLAFLIGFIIFGSFGMIALLTGVISENMFTKNQLRMEEERRQRENMHKLLLQKCSEMFDAMPSQQGCVAREDIIRLLPNIERMFEAEGISFAHHDLSGMIDLLDPNGCNALSKRDLSHGIIQIAEGLRPISIIRLHYDVSFIKDTMASLAKQQKEAVAAMAQLRSGLQELAEQGRAAAASAAAPQGPEPAAPEPAGAGGQGPAPAAREPVPRAAAVARAPEAPPAPDSGTGTAPSAPELVAPRDPRPGAESCQASLAELRGSVLSLGQDICALGRQLQAIAGSEQLHESRCPAGAACLLLRGDPQKRTSASGIEALMGLVQELAEGQRRTEATEALTMLVGADAHPSIDASTCPQTPTETSVSGPG